MKNSRNAVTLSGSDIQTPLFGVNPIACIIHSVIESGYFRLKVRFPVLKSKPNMLTNLYFLHTTLVNLKIEEMNFMSKVLSFESSRYETYVCMYFLYFFPG